MAPSIPIDFSGQKGSKNCSVAPMMGKARKVSKGSISGFVPDYRHSVETVGESEGFGSSVKVETEMAASENSLPTKRKFDGLYSENNDRYGVPAQVFSLSMISRSKRKDLKTRLKMELEQLRSFEREVSLNSNVVFSPSSETRSCSDGKKRLPNSSSQGAPAMSNIQQGRKLAPPRKGHGLKQCQSGKIQPGSSTATLGTLYDTLLKQCLTLLGRLMSHQYGWVFNVPVDAEMLNIPDYHNVIKQPMDLGTVKRRLTSGEYSSLVNFANDVRLTFSNAMTYNPRGTDVHIMAETLSKIFETRWKQIEKKLNSSVGTLSIPSRVGSPFGIGNGAPMHNANKNEASSTDSKIKLDSVRRTMTDKEKQSLSTELEALLGELPDNIVDFLKEQSSTAGQNCEDEIEIDLEALGDDTLFQLRKLLDEYKLEKQKIQLGAEPHVIEQFLREPEISNSCVPPVKGYHPADIDVDIGENDPPLANYPPVEIDKDAAHKESKQISSSTSSSESGSSSSDSGSSSDHESDAPEVSAHANILKVSLADPVQSIDKSDMKNDGTDTPHIVETDCQNKLPHTDTESLQEAADAPSERPVSPDKLYRAALLRSRFADTILKAREKTLEKGENQDPEKLRIEREELERQQKAEKARLLAEAKAAEEARKKAEAEAVAEAATEARRKRELEREAAREALLKMEKTVEINENSKFLEDLEMLRATAAEEVVPSTSAEEKSPDQSQSLERLGSFNFQVNSNPLEQLGLYMKADEEEEEEAGEERPD